VIAVLNWVGVRWRSDSKLLTLAMLGDFSGFGLLVCWGRWCISGKRRSKDVRFAFGGNKQIRMGMRLRKRPSHTTVEGNEV